MTDLKKKMADLYPAQAPSSSKRLQKAIILGVVFGIIASPFTFRKVDDIVKKFSKMSILNDDGTPSMFGLAVHSVVFAIIAYILIR